MRQNEHSKRICAVWLQWELAVCKCRSHLRALFRRRRSALRRGQTAMRTGACSEIRFCVPQGVSLYADIALLLMPRESSSLPARQPNSAPVNAPPSPAAYGQGTESHLWPGFGILLSNCTMQVPTRPAARAASYGRLVGAHRRTLRSLCAQHTARLRSTAARKKWCNTAATDATGSWWCASAQPVRQVRRLSSVVALRWLIAQFAARRRKRKKQSKPMEGMFTS